MNTSYYARIYTFIRVNSPACYYCPYFIRPQSQKNNTLQPYGTTQLSRKLTFVSLFYWPSFQRVCLLPVLFISHLIDVPNFTKTTSPVKRWKQNHTFNRITHARYVTSQSFLGISEVKKSLVEPSLCIGLNNKTKYKVFNSLEHYLRCSQSREILPP